MTTTLVFPIMSSNAADNSGGITSSNAVYATAQAGSGLTVTTSNWRAGQQGPASYALWEGLLELDFAVFTGETVTTAALHLPVNTATNRVASSVVEVREYNYGTSITTADWLNPTTLGARTLVAHGTLASGTTSGDIVTFTDDAWATSIAANLGLSRYIVATDRERLGTVPTGYEGLGSTIDGTSYLAVTSAGHDSYSDNFNRANETPALLDPWISHNGVNNGPRLTSNQGSFNGTAVNNVSATYGRPLSSMNMYGQMSVAGGAGRIGIDLRPVYFAKANQIDRGYRVYYQASATGNDGQLIRVAKDGTTSNPPLAFIPDADEPGRPYTLRAEISGATNPTIVVKRAGVTIISLVDEGSTALLASDSEPLAGVYGDMASSGGSTFDDWAEGIIDPHLSGLVGYSAKGTQHDPTATETNVVLTRPSVNQNDLMVAYIMTRGNATIASGSVPTGWTLVRNQGGGTTTTQPRIFVYQKIAGASEPSTYTWTLNTANNVAGDILVFNGVDTTTPINANGGTDSGTTAVALIDWAGITSTVDGGMLVTFAEWKNQETATASQQGMTARAFHNAVTVLSGEVYTQALGPAGGTGQRRFTNQLGTTSDAAVVGIIIAPAPITNKTASDSGAGTDSSDVVAAYTASDAGTGAEVTPSNEQVAFSLTDANISASDQSVVSTLNLLTASDSGTGTDVAVVDQVVLFSATDSGSGSESGTQVTAGFEFVEPAYASDMVVDLSAAILATEVGNVAESSVVGLTSLLGDSGVGTDASALHVFHDVVDQGIGGQVVSFAGFQYVDPEEVAALMSTTIKQASPTTPEPRSDILRLDATTNQRMQVLLDVSRGIPPGVGARVLFAQLFLYKAGPWPAGSATVTLTPIDAPWDASTVAWNSKPPVRSAEAVSYVVAGAGADGDRITLDVTSIVGKTVTADLPWHGLLIETNVNGDSALHSAFSAIPDFRPVLKLEYRLPPDAPFNLSPAADRFVSERKPELIAQWRDADAQDTVGAIQIQISLDDTFAAPLYDSGKCVTNDTRFDLNAPLTGAPAVSNLNYTTRYYWRMKSWDNYDLEGPWSDSVSFFVQAKGALVLSAPSGSTVTSPTPRIAWTFTPAGAETQSQVEIVLSELIGGVWQDVYRFPRQVTSLSEITIPDDARLIEGEDYLVTARVWDSVNREDMPGDRAYLEATQEIALVGVSV